jgi:hypothetical protein
MMSKPRQQKRPKNLIEHVRQVMPHVREWLYDGYDNDAQMVCLVEERLKAFGEWQRFNQQNEGGNPDVISNVSCASADEAFAMGVAYGLCVNGSAWLNDKGGAR